MLQVSKLKRHLRSFQIKKSENFQQAREKLKTGFKNVKSRLDMFKKDKELTTAVAQEQYQNDTSHDSVDSSDSEFDSSHD